MEIGKRICLTVAIMQMFCCLCVAEPQIVNIYGRRITSLNGEWRVFPDLQQTGLYNFHGVKEGEGKRYFADLDYRADRSKLIEYNFDEAGSAVVPADWNTQKEQWYYYEGSMWYRTEFSAKPVEGKRYFLYFGAVNYRCETALNNTVLGYHEGGFTPFNYEVTQVMNKGINSLVLNVDNTRTVSGVPTMRFDWWNYGGITRDVMLVETPQTFIRDYSISLDSEKRSKILVKVFLDGPELSQDITVTIPELRVEKKCKTDNNGIAEFSIDATPVLWTPDNPKLYNVSIVSSSDKVSDRIGFRTIEVKGASILLNGEPIFLKGVAVHEETIGKNPGRVTNISQARQLIAVAKEMNCNFLRLTHYPHSELMIRAAEESGMLVWEEIPCYWAIDWSNPSTYSNAEEQLSDIITRDRNRANVIIWSVANETPKSPERLKFLTSLINKARSMDSTRLISAALLTNYIDIQNSVITVDDDLAEYTDLLCFNEYVGWYDGDPSHCSEMKWVFPVEKPVVVTEFGGGAKYRLSGEESFRFTENHLESIYKGQIEMFSRMPYLCGTCPWVLKDFRSPRRMHPSIQGEYNRKGLVDERGRKKKAFHIMKKYYSEK